MHRAIILAAGLIFAVIAPAQAKHRHHGFHVYQHHFGRYLVQHHWRYLNRRYARRLRHFDHPGRHYVRMHNPRTGRGVSLGLAHARLPDGHVITVAAAFVDRFVGFFQELFAREHRLPEIGCYSPTGHMRNSLHHWGGACDVGQRARNVAWRPMYRVTALAHSYGLTDGCEWRGSPDCGHIEVNRRVAWHRRPQTYQVAQAWPL